LERGQFTYFCEKSFTYLGGLWDAKGTHLPDFPFIGPWLWEIPYTLPKPLGPGPFFIFAKILEVLLGALWRQRGESVRNLFQLALGRRKSYTLCQTHWAEANSLFFAKIL
jgi:hypothetical protein